MPVVTNKGLFFAKKPEKKKLKSYDLPIEKSHDNIRLEDQFNAVKHLKLENSFELVTNWGFGKFGFLYSFINTDFHDHKCYYADLKGSFNVEEIHRKFTDDIGSDISSFISNPEKEYRILILDNIEKLTLESLKLLHELHKASNDYTETLKIIFIVNEFHGISSAKITLGPLTLSEISEYLKSGSDIQNIPRETLDKVLEISNGLPLILDKIIFHAKYMSLDEVLDSGDIAIDKLDELPDIPHELSKIILNIKRDDARLFKLLTLFSILDCGETFTNLRSAFSEDNFKVDDISALERYRLLTASSKENYKILRISPIVKDFIKSNSSSDELISIVRSALSICLGNEWGASKVRIQPVTQMMLKHEEFYPGNVHNLIKIYFSNYNGDIDSKDYNHIIYTALSYCVFLKHKSYYKELVSFSRMVFDKISSVSSNDKYRIAYHLAAGLRMVDKDQMAISFLEPVLTSYESEKYRQKQYALKMYETLMLAYVDVNKLNAYDYAKKIKKLTKHSQGQWIFAESILAHDLPKDEVIPRLKFLFNKAKKKKANDVANNIALKLYKLLPHKAEGIIDYVIDNDPTEYTRVRAYVNKYEDIVNNNNFEKLDQNALSHLTYSYDYLFSQRQIGLFNRCTSILWAVYEQISELNLMYSLFRKSSILWRLDASFEKEYEYAKGLFYLERKLVKDLNGFEYLEYRYNYLSNLYEI